MPFIAQVGLGLLWFLVGCVIAIPYTFLANGTFENFFLTAWIAPATMFFTFLLYVMRRVGRRDNKQLKWGGWFFWAVVAYFCLPIILNGASLLLKEIGYEVASNYAFKGRFASLLAVPMTFVIMMGAADTIHGIRHRPNGDNSPDSNHTTPT